MNIFLDFDGTIVEHDYPEIGEPNPNALEVIKKLQDAGHHIILNTMRVEFNDETLEAALDYLNLNDKVKGINILQHTQWKIHPPRWNLDKIENDLYIDDIAANIPLIKASMVNGFMVDWVKIESQLLAKGLLVAESFCTP